MLRKLCSVVAFRLFASWLYPAAVNMKEMCSLTMYVARSEILSDPVSRGGG
jgi:hypothetical protein